MLAAMRPRLPSLSALRAFEAAARHQSFRLAADELAVTPTAVSHQIRALEDELGVRLFVRMTRAVSLTPEGVALYRASRQALDGIADAAERLRKPARQAITLSTTPAFAAKWLVPRLTRFAQAHPDIDLHVQTSCGLADVQAGAADLTIRYGHGRYPGLAETLLFADRFAPVASAALKVRKPADLRRHTLIHFDTLWPAMANLSWEAWARHAGDKKLDTSAGIRYSEESHAIQAAIAGQGVALVSLTLVQEELRMGLLEARVGPALDGMAYRVVRPRQASEAVKTVEAWLLREADEANAMAATEGGKASQAKQARSAK